MIEYFGGSTFMTQKEIRQFWNDQAPECERSFNRLKKQRTFTPFIGAGMSVEFKLPTWTAFLKSLIDKIIEDDKRSICNELLRSNKYLEAAEAINRFTNYSVTFAVQQQFGNPKIKSSTSSYISILKSKGINSFVTTNYDEIIEILYGKDLKRYLPQTGDISMDYAEATRQDLPRLLKLHGTCTNQGSIILTQEHYDKNYGSHGKLVPILKKLWTESTLLFLGCSLYKDPLIEQLHKYAAKERNIYHYAILERPSDPTELKEKESWLFQLHIVPIWYPEKRHDAVKTILKMLCSNKKDQNNGIRNIYENNSNNISTNCLDQIALKIHQRKDDDLLYNALMVQSNLFSSANSKNAISLTDLCKDIRNVPYVLSIEGPPGTGKSTLLSLLYLATKDQASVDMSNEQFFLFDLHRYDMDDPQNAEMQLTQNLSIVESAFARYDKIIVFVDGIDNYIRINSRLEQIILSTLARWNSNNNYSEKMSIVFSIGMLDNNDFPPFSRNQINNPCHINRKITLKCLDTNSRTFGKFVKKLLELENLLPNGEKAQNKLKTNVVNYCKLASNDYSEFRTVYFLISKYPSYKNDLFEYPIGMLYYDHYIKEFNNDVQILKSVAKTIAHFMLDISAPPKISVMPHYVYKCPTIRDFFLSMHYVNALQERNQIELELFSCIFTLRLNRFLVSLISMAPDKEINIAKNCIDLFPFMNLPQQIQIAYLLGRMHNEKAIILAASFLEKKYDEVKAKIEFESQNTDHVMLFRTIGISLLYLHKYKKLDDFLGQIIYNKQVRDVNRNFHSQYYALKNAKLGSGLQLDDSSCCSPEQLKKLYSQLYSSVLNPASPELRCVSIITLLNLVIYNHYINKPKKSADLMTNEFNKLLDTLSKDSSITNSIVKEYILNVQNYITVPNIYGMVFDDIAKLKEIVRKGWTLPERAIDNPEVVASHSWSACILAEVLLTDSLQDCRFASAEEILNHKSDYNKVEVIKLLLIHDMAEIQIGDLTPDDENYSKKTDLEKAVFTRMGALASFPYFPAFAEISRLGNKFIVADSFNSQLANDFDKLDALIQVYAYRNRFPPETSSKVKGNWILYVNERLKTTLGRNIFSFIKEFLFEQSN